MIASIVNLPCISTGPIYNAEHVQKPQLTRTQILTLTLARALTLTTGLIYNAEHVQNPQLPDYFTALYFGLTTLTTVGFGDITPITAQGRLIVR